MPQSADPLQSGAWAAGHSGDRFSPARPPSSKRPASAEGRPQLLEPVYSGVCGSVLRTGGERTQVTCPSLPTGWGGTNGQMTERSFSRLGLRGNSCSPGASPPLPNLPRPPDVLRSTEAYRGCSRLRRHLVPWNSARRAIPVPVNKSRTLLGLQPRKPSPWDTLQRGMHLAGLDSRLPRPLTGSPAPAGSSAGWNSVSRREKARPWARAGLGQRRSGRGEVRLWKPRPTRPGVGAA